MENADDIKTESAGSVAVGKSRFIVAAIGLGQGGTSAAQEWMKLIGQSYDRLMSINLSDLDLNGAALVPEKNRLLLDKNRFGAGKNRDASKSYAIEKKDAILKFVSDRIAGVNIIFVFFATAGGTGSGLGPLLTALFESDELPKNSGGPDTIVIGVPLLPDSIEGELGQSNTLEALKEISAYSSKGVARFMLVDNNVHVDAKDDVSKWTQINQDVASMLRRYLFTTYTSKIANLDQEDRFRLLLAPGCHALCTYNPENPSQYMSPFVLPEGALVKKMGAEIPEGFTASRLTLSSVIGAQVDEPNFCGYYALGTEGATPIVHFAGFSNLRKVSERYQGWLSQIQQKSAAAKKVDAAKGTGFSLITKNKEHIANESTTKTGSKFEDLLAISEEDGE